MSELDRLVAVMAQLRSPGGCAWDAEQTHESLVRYLLEETAELVEAIETHDVVRDARGARRRALPGAVPLGPRLGDAGGGVRRRGRRRDTAAKMIGRHPHVFGDAEAEDADEVVELGRAEGAGRRPTGRAWWTASRWRAGASASRRSSSGRPSARAWRCARAVPVPDDEDALGDALLDTVIAASREGARRGARPPRRPPPLHGRHPRGRGAAGRLSPRSGRRVGLSRLCSVHGGCGLPGGSLRVGQARGARPRPSATARLEQLPGSSRAPLLDRRPSPGACRRHRRRPDIAPRGSRRTSSSLSEPPIIPSVSSPSSNSSSVAEIRGTRPSAALRSPC